MRRSCLVPPSTEETDDSFEHVSASSIFPWLSIFLVELIALCILSYEADGVQLSVAACCYNYPSKSSLSASSLCTTYYLEL